VLHKSLTQKKLSVTDQPQLLILIVSILLCYEYDIHKYYKIFSLIQFILLLTSIREATCFGIFKLPSSGLPLDEYCTRMLHQWDPMYLLLKNILIKQKLPDR
jgi:hypothetical protein